MVNDTLPARGLYLAVRRKRRWKTAFGEGRDVRKNCQCSARFV